jgi:hypothetical protein
MYTGEVAQLLVMLSGINAGYNAPHSSFEKIRPYSEMAYKKTFFVFNFIKTQKIIKFGYHEP